MTYRALYDQCEDELADAEAVAEFFTDRQSAWAPHGARANAYWFAPTGDNPHVLRLDIDYDNQRAALRWLPDATHAVELDTAGPIVVLETSDRDVVTIPAQLARVSVDTAHRAVAEYVTTGQKPTCVRWAAERDANQL